MQPVFFLRFQEYVYIFSPPHFFRLRRAKNTQNVYIFRISIHIPDFSAQEYVYNIHYYVLKKHCRTYCKISTILKKCRTAVKIELKRLSRMISLLVFSTVDQIYTFPRHFHFFLSPQSSNPHKNQQW